MAYRREHTGDMPTKLPFSQTTLTTRLLTARAAERSSQPKLRAYWIETSSGLRMRWILDDVAISV